MAFFVGRNELFFWIPAGLIAVALTTAVYLQIRRLPNTHRARYIVGDSSRGAELFYGEKQCGICHSVNGSGGRTAPELSGMRPETPAMGWLATVLWNHGPSMWRQIRSRHQPYPELNSQEMADILAFLYQASSIDRPGNPTTGQKVFNEKGCVRCHSVAGQGGKTAPALSAAIGKDSEAWSGAMLNHAGSMVAPIASTLGQWPQFTDNEMTDLISYVSANGPSAASFPPETRGDAQEGWAVFQERCMQCHSVRGRGGTAGPELGPEQALPLTTTQFASVMWNHAPAMLQKAHEMGVPPPQLQGQNLTDLLAFLASLRYLEPAGSALIGQRVFAERGCATCHGKTAAGTQMGPALKTDGEPYNAVSFITALWRHGPKMTDRAEELGIAWPTLEANDVGDIVSFLNAPNPK